MKLMLNPDSEIVIKICELWTVILWYKLNPRVRCAFGNVSYIAAIIQLNTDLSVLWKSDILWNYYILMFALIFVTFSASFALTWTKVCQRPLLTTFLIRWICNTEHILVIIGICDNKRQTSLESNLSWYIGNVQSCMCRLALVDKWICSDWTLSILFYRAGVYWIYILSILPGYLGCNFQYTPALEKRMAIHCLSQDVLENKLPSAICIPRSSRLPLGYALVQSLRPWGANCLRGRIFQYIPPLGSVLLQDVTSIYQGKVSNLYEAPILLGRKALAGNV